MSLRRATCMIPAILGTYWKVLKAFFLRPRTQQSNWILDSKCTDSLPCKYISHFFLVIWMRIVCFSFLIVVVVNLHHMESDSGQRIVHVWMENLLFYGCRWCVKIISSSSLCCLQGCSASSLTIYANNIIVTKLEMRNCNWLRAQWAHSSFIF